MDALDNPLAELAARIRRDGFALVPAAGMRPVLRAEGLDAAGPDWTQFARSWDELGPDTYMADGGRYRKRRHAVLRVAADAIQRLPQQPHWQSRDHNALNGGIARWFEPVADAVLNGPAMGAVLRASRALWARLDPAAAAWRVELHQFRIEARADEAGRPTPEGSHRDGVDWVLVLMIGRQNIRSGETSIHAPDGTPLGSFTLREPMDAALVDDHRVFHGVTPVEPEDPAQPAHRDVLVVTFRREDGAAG